MIEPAIRLLDVGIDPVDRETLVATVRSHVSGPANPLLHIATINPEYIMLARKRPPFAAAIQTADLHTIDGIGVLIAASLLHRGRIAPLQRMTGIDLVFVLAELAQDAGCRLFLLGGKPGAAEASARSLTRALPGLAQPSIWDGGSARAIDDAVTFDLISAAEPAILLVAYGAPGQLEWIERNCERLDDAGVRIAIGVGGSFDAISGLSPRAPAFLRHIGLEWLYRLIREPWRWRRQLVLPHFALLALRQILAERTQGKAVVKRAMAYPCRNARPGSEGSH